MSHPTFNHTRADGQYDPCPICLELMSREQLVALVKDMRAARESLVDEAAEIVEKRRVKILNTPDDPSYTEHFAEIQGEILKMKDRL